MGKRKKLAAKILRYEVESAVNEETENTKVVDEVGEIEVAEESTEDIDSITENVDILLEEAAEEKPVIKKSRKKSNKNKDNE